MARLTKGSTMPNPLAHKRRGEVRQDTPCAGVGWAYLRSGRLRRGRLRRWWSPLHSTPDVDRYAGSGSEGVRKRSLPITRASSRPTALERDQILGKIRPGDLGEQIAAALNARCVVPAVNAAGRKMAAVPCPWERRPLLPAPDRRTGEAGECPVEGDIKNRTTWRSSRGSIRPNTEQPANEQDG